MLEKFRGRAKQMELMKWIEESDTDVCIVCETGLNDDEYVEVSKKYTWMGNN